MYVALRRAFTARAIVQTLVYVHITIKAIQVFAFWALQHDSWLLITLIC